MERLDLTGGLFVWECFSKTDMKFFLQKEFFEQA